MSQGARTAAEMLSLMIKTMELNPSEYAPFYANYVSYAKESSGLEAIANSTADLHEILNPLRSNEELGNYRYAEDKWTVKQLVLHLIDSEVNFMMRALWALRKENSELPGFDHNKWVVENRDDTTTLDEALNWFESQRATTLHLFKSVREDQWSNEVTANGVKFTVRSLAAIVCGHTRHHTHIISERYIKPKEWQA